MIRLSRVGRVVLLVVWGGALAMAVALVWRVNRLDATMQRTEVHSKELVKSADELAASVKELDEAMQRLKARVDALDAGDAQIVFERR